MQEELRVSVLVITYNHEKYIRHALDSVLMQKTSFRMEVIVHDDASTDDTPKILKEYEKKYPNRLSIIYQEENQYSKGTSITREILIPKAKGKYIAFLEGDDYWTDEYKLAKQVRILDEHPELSGCVHNVIVVDENEIPWNSGQGLFRVKEDTIQDFRYLDNVSQFSHFAAVMMRRELFTSMDKDSYHVFSHLQANGDMLFAAIMAANGKIYHMCDDMACYRCVTQGTGSWTSRNRNKNISLVTYKMLMEIRHFIKDTYGIEINYNKFRRALCYIAVRKWQKDPTDDNKMIMQTITKDYGYGLFHYITDIPVYVIKKIRNRKKT